MGCVMHVMDGFEAAVVQDAEKADLRSQPLRIACNLQQRFGAQPKEQVIHHALVLQSQRCQFMRQSEN
jgi:hypothetical protein